MRIFAILMLSCTVMLCASCIKAPLKDRVVYGQIVDSATYQPLAAATFILVREYKEGSFPNTRRKEEVFSFATDKAGNFRVMYRAAKNDGVYITHPNVSIYDGGYQFWSDVIGTEKEVNAGVIKAYLK